MTPKRSRAEEAYRNLGVLGRGPMGPEVVAELRRVLGGSTSLLIARAATIAGERGLTDLIPGMLAAFARIAPGGLASDKGCRAKTAIVEALSKLEYLGGDVYEAGARIVQMEPSFGPPEDTAVVLRSACALALARVQHTDAHYILADMLFDQERPVRVAAVKALTYLATLEGELMLRVKLLGGDEVEVLAECFAGLMTMSPVRSLPFVARYLTPLWPTLMESAALAIATAKTPEALAALRDAWEESIGSSLRVALLLPIALTRSDDAFAFLLDVVRDEPPRLAVEAVGVLNLYPAEAYVERLRAVVEKGGDPSIAARFRVEFGGDSGSP